MCAPFPAPTGDPACNPAMCPDWESTGDPLVPRQAATPAGAATAFALGFVVYGVRVPQPGDLFPIPTPYSSCVNSLVCISVLIWKVAWLPRLKEFVHLNDTDSQAGPLRGCKGRKRRSLLMRSLSPCAQVRRWVGSRCLGN